MEIYFATSNENKFAEARDIFSAHAPSHTLKHFQFLHNEIRSDDLSEIAEEAATVAYSKLKKPVFVEDTGLFIDALNGFPGTYSGWVQKKIGNKGILKLLESEETADKESKSNEKKEKNRAARFETVVCFTADGKEFVNFRGICEGTIAEKPRGVSGFGYDPIFIPAGHKKTFAENIELKNKLSHRYKSIMLFIEYLNNYYDYGSVG